MVRTKALMLYPETIWFIYVERASNPTGSCRSVIGIQGQELISDQVQIALIDAPRIPQKK